jgi:hypothetical protein
MLEDSRMENRINANPPMDSRESLRRPGESPELIVYQAPDETLQFNPTPEEMSDIILHTPHGYWLQGGNGEAAIRIGRRPGDKRAVAHGVRLPDGSGADFLKGFPELWIKQPEPGLFYFTWSGTDIWIPYDGTSCEAYVMDECGGDPLKIARACLVDGPTAVKIVHEYLRTQDRSNAVSWIMEADLPVPADWYPWA